METTFIFLLLNLFILNMDTVLGLTVKEAMAKCRPQQVHLSYGDSSSEIVVMWSTNGQCSTVVKYSKVWWNLDQTSHGESRLFGGEQNPNGVQNVHMVKVQNLESNSTYFYIPMSSGVMDAVYYFRTPPDTSASSDVTLMVVSGLTSGSPVTPSLVTELHTGKYSALLHAGNLARNLSTDGGMVADRYFRQLEPGLAYVPYMTSPGEWEHEADDQFNQYRFRLTMPRAGWPMPLDKMWYSVDVGPVHLISFSTEAILSSEGKYSSYQHDWLIKDLKLANGNRDIVPWVVAFGHHPLYCTYEDPDLDCSSKTSALRKELEDIFYHYGVDILITSFGKYYERSYPMYKGVQVSDNYTSPKGPIHIMTGGATPWNLEYNYTAKEPEWVAERLPNETRASFGRLHIINGSIAEYEQVAFADGAILDSFSIFQSDHGEFSIAELPANVSAEIDKKIVDAGGKPGVLNIHEIGTTDTTGEKLAKLLNDPDNKTKVIIGASVGSFFVILIIAIIFVRRMRRRRRVTRRWEQMDIDYGKKYYSKAPDKDEDNDFEIDMSDGTEANRKLLNAGD